jgi:hypothetical protein
MTKKHQQQLSYNIGMFVSHFNRTQERQNSAIAGPSPDQEGEGGGVTSR